MKARIHITLKNGVLDPQGKAVQNALGSLGFDGVGDVRQGKYMEIELSETEKTVEQMCQKLLANTVIENYTIKIGD